MTTHKNLAVSTVATAPSPATSGTTLVVAAGEGARFMDPAVDGTFPVTIGPAGAVLTSANSEIALCTARSTDTLTITRATDADGRTEGVARTVIVGDQVIAGITKGIYDRDMTIALFAAGIGRT